MKRFLASLFLAGALFTTPILAQEPEGAKSAEDKKEGLEIWKAVNFVILAGILGYLIKKNVGPLLTARSKEITEGLAAGERANAEAKAKAAAVDLRLAGLEKEIASLRENSRAERDQEAERLKREAQREMERIRRQAAAEIESASKHARVEVQRHAARLALDLAEKKLRDRMSPDTQAALAERFVADMAGDMAGKGAR
jgi:F-type H+-transporting ATPase subunit b